MTKAQITPSPEAMKKFVCEVMPAIMMDLQRKGKLPPGYGGAEAAGHEERSTMVTTNDLLEAIRADIRRELREEILAELQPEIERRLYGNVFNLKQAKRYLNISESTLRRDLADPDCRIPFFKHRGQYFFRQTSLDRYMDELENCCTGNRIPYIT